MKTLDKLDKLNNMSNLSNIFNNSDVYFRLYEYGNINYIKNTNKYTERNNFYLYQYVVLKVTRYRFEILMN